MLLLSMEDREHTAADGVVLLTLQDAKNRDHRKNNSIAPTAKRVLAHFERSIYEPFRDDWQLGKVDGVEVQDRTGSRFRRTGTQPTEASASVQDSFLVFEGA